MSVVVVARSEFTIVNNEDFPISTKYAEKDIKTLEKGISSLVKLRAFRFYYECAEDSMLTPLRHTIIAGLLKLKSQSDYVKCSVCKEFVKLFERMITSFPLRKLSLFIAGKDVSEINFLVNSVSSVLKTCKYLCELELNDITNLNSGMTETILESLFPNEHRQHLIKSLKMDFLELKRIFLRLLSLLRELQVENLRSMFENRIALARKDDFL